MNSKWIVIIHTDFLEDEIMEFRTRDELMECIVKELQDNEELKEWDFKIFPPFTEIRFSDIPLHGINKIFKK